MIRSQSDRFRKTAKLSAVIALALLILAACGDDIPSPRERVLAFVKEVKNDTLPDISKYIDFDSVATYEYAADRYDTLTMAEKKDLLVREFTGGGEYRRIWGGSQIVVNHEYILDDTTANVEVSFIDRETRIQYYNQMRLKRRGDWWVVTAFKAAESQ